MLCDSVQLSDGKLYILGGGWEQTRPNNPNMGLAIVLSADCKEFGKTVEFIIELQNGSGKPVLLKENNEPLQIICEFKDIKANPDHPKDMPISLKQAINLQGLPLEPGQIYSWDLKINGESRAKATFYTSDEMK